MVKLDIKAHPRLGHHFMLNGGFDNALSLRIQGNIFRLWLQNAIGQLAFQDDDFSPDAWFSAVGME